MNTNQIIILNWIRRNEVLSFKGLKERGGFTDGNLASHLRALKGGKLINHQKIISGSYPNSTYTITSKGKRILNEFMDSFIEVRNK